MNVHPRLTLLGVLAGGLALSALAQEKPAWGMGTVDPKEGAKLFKKPGFSPYAGRNYPTHVYWGDTHLHTSMSLDARAGGNTLGPEEALRFARGEEVVAATGEPAKLSRPLDWLVVSDHSDALGTMNEIANGNPQLMNDPTCRRWHDAIAQGGEPAVKAAFEIVIALSSGKIPPLCWIRS